MPLPGERIPRAGKRFSISKREKIKRIAKIATGIRAMRLLFEMITAAKPAKERAPSTRVMIPSDGLIPRNSMPFFDRSPSTGSSAQVVILPAITKKDPNTMASVAPIEMP